MKLCRRLILNSSFLILNFSKSAFSLIELSIVLIIIGLLVAGVTGGASLIQSAKMRAVMNEARNWKQAVSTFYAAKGRLPGDLNDDGVIGVYISYDGSKCFDKTKQETYTSSSFSGYSNVNFITAPFADLSIEKIIDFVPKDLKSDSLLSYISGGYEGDRSGCYLAANVSTDYMDVMPRSTTYKDLYWSTFFTVDNYTDNTKSPLNSSEGSKIFITLNNLTSTKDIEKSLMQKLDTKFDDGETYTGSIRSVCNQDVNYPGFYIASNGKGKYDQKHKTDYCDVALFEVWKR